MSFTPTKEHLEELGFTNNPEFPSIYTRNNEDSERFSNKITYSFVTRYFYIWDSFLYPQSIEDIQTLIKLLTPPN